MSLDSILGIFQGIQTLFAVDPTMAFARIGLIFLGILLVYLGKKEVLEPLLMIPMGLGMATVNAGVMFFDPLMLHNGIGTLFLESQAGSALTSAAQAGANAAQVATNGAMVADLMTIIQIDFLQPIYTFMFSNGLIACLVFLGIGSLLDIGFIMAHPLISMFLAICAELGTILVLPIATMFGYTPQEAAAIAMVGGADGPMVLFTSLKLAPALFVPIAVVAYLYLGLTYGGYPYLIKLMVPKSIRGTEMPKPVKPPVQFTAFQKLMLAVVLCVLLTFLFPVAGPLFFSLFLGICIRESGIKAFQDLVSTTILYTATLFLGLTLGILCEASTIFDAKVLPLLLLGILSLLLSGIGGLIGGYIVYFFKNGKYNPVIGIAGVSCVPSTAKVAQKVVAKTNPNAIIMQYALGANISGVITTAIIAAVYVTILGAK
ncbi:MAG TPA: sodium ion-translocating decarboxylase subunit beta [Treponemataceae bacterium]|nr:sodium ion-translocating decarboxylase subunit beta [Treponemataceae bacterium]